MPTATGKTLAFGRATLPGDNLCIIFVSATTPASEADWAEYVAWFRSTVKPGSKVKSVVFDRAGGPNATQRKQVNDMTASCSLHVAVLSPSAVGRSVVTAMNWFKKDSYKAFMPNELDAAIAFLEITGSTAIDLRQTVLNMLRDLDR
jgi:hypothetical protein